MVQHETMTKHSDEHEVSESLRVSVNESLPEDVAQWMLEESETILPESSLVSFIDALVGVLGHKRLLCTFPSPSRTACR